MRSRWNGSVYIDFINSDSLYRLFSVIDDGTNPVNYYYSGELVTDAAYPVTNKAINLNRIGGTGYQASQQYAGIMQEAIFYDSDKSSVRTDIEENIGDYFTQNTPLLDTYTGAAAAYSLRLRTAYTGDAVEVYNGSSYADIGFNVFGELDTVALAATVEAMTGSCRSGTTKQARTTHANEHRRICRRFTTGVRAW